MAKTNHFGALVVMTVVVLAAGLLVLAGTSQEAEAAFPGEDGKIAFQSNRVGPDNPEGDFEIYAMNPNGSDQTNLTNHPAIDSRPAHAPDGTRIAFTSERDGNQEIYVMNATGSGQTRLTNNAASDSQPAFSSDGSKISFVSDRDGNQEIYAMNPDGSGTPARLTDNPAFDGAPAFSPDGSKIAFATNRDEFNVEVYVMNSDGSGQTGLTDGADTYSDHSPAFSPDGSKIAFQSYYGCDNNYCGPIIDGGIAVMNSDGSGRTQLTYSGADYQPDWGVQAPDTRPPETTITSGPNGSANDNTPTFTFSGSDDASANLLFSYKVDDGQWSAYSSQTSATLQSLPDGPHTFYVKAKDEAGNEDSSPAERSFTVETAASTGSVVINNNAASTRSRSVTLALNATDSSPGSGVNSMRVANSQSGVSSASWEPYATTKLWTLSSGTGTKTVYVQYRDAAGNISAVAWDTIKYKR